ncbi:MAG TPA: RNA polymerase-binding protein DksA [Gammaproteobacteria bacterium]|jgi:DnaK suppressor protein|nr:RNA polymerase-binding protein DksA [Gammaproteobacteria bacterium]
MSNTHALPVKGFEPYKEKEGEQYMSKAQLEHFTKLLQVWKQQLQEEVERTVHNMRDEANNFADPADRASQEEEFALELRARDRERKLIRKIDQTLDLIRKDDYGYCEQCGIEIGLRRLEARPTATLCIDCKTLEEIREKQRVA